MPQSLAKILVHAVFSTKERRPFLRDRSLLEELNRYLGGHSQSSGLPTDNCGRGSRIILIREKRRGNLSLLASAATKTSFLNHALSVPDSAHERASCGRI